MTRRRGSRRGKAGVLAPRTFAAGAAVWIPGRPSPSRADGRRPTPQTHAVPVGPPCRDVEDGRLLWLLIVPRSDSLPRHTGHSTRPRPHVGAPPPAPRAFSILALKSQIATTHQPEAGSGDTRRGDTQTLNKESTMESLSDRLNAMLLEKKYPPSSSKGPLIQEVKMSGTTNGNDTALDDEDDCGPPDIQFGAASSYTAGTSQQVAGGVESSSRVGTSLAEQMFLEGERARAEQTKREQRKAKKATFGLQKGFLVNAPSRKAKKRDKKRNLNRNTSSRTEDSEREKSNTHPSDQDDSHRELIHELDGEGNMVPISDGDARAAKANPLHMPEVQSSMAQMLKDQTSDWATPDLLEKIARDHPKLAAGLGNPRYAAALQSMQTDPKGTLERLRRDSPDVLSWLQEFCGLMGEHFVKLGAEQGAGEEKAQPARTSQNVREIGPLEEKAMRRNNRNESNAKQAGELDDQVLSILGDEELRSILLDPKMQSVMEECTQPGKVRYYMSHEQIGPKLRKLMDAGLLSLA